MISTLIILSLEESTRFLDAIPSTIVKKHHEKVEVITIEASADVESIIKKISLVPQESMVVFLGHGASYCIYLPVEEGKPKQQLINKANFEVIVNKNFISLSCKSSEFLRNNFSDRSVANMIGFENLPTHWEDVDAERQLDGNAYSGITDNVIENYRNLLVQVFLNSLLDTIEANEGLNFLYLRLKLYTNKLIAQVNLEKISDNPNLLADILFELKHGITFFGKTA